MKEKQKKPSGVLIAAVLIIIAIIGAIIISGIGESSGNVIVIPLHGIIAIDEDSSLLGTAGASSTDIVEQITRAEEDATVKAILLDINSPGGSPVASEEIAHAISQTTKPIVALIRETGTSGAYWAASSADHVIASRMSITGSVGVLGSYLEYADLLSRFNITEQRLVAGKYKDLGNPAKKLSSAEKNLLQQKIDLMQTYFLEEVQNNRNLTEDEVDTISTGVFYLGTEALDLHLIDEIGNEKTAIAYLESAAVLNETVTLKTYPVHKSLIEELAGLTNQIGFSTGRGMASTLLEKKFTITT
ncbi:MAG: signal peptide peptidase SppA [archaeon]